MIKAQKPKGATVLKKGSTKASGSKTGRTSAARNQQGQALGEKGRRTRLYLIEITEELLWTTSLGALTVAEIARVAGVSTATFYLYFQDTRAALLAVISRISLSTPELVEMLSTPWGVDEGHEKAYAFVEAYVEAWRAHAAPLRIRNVVADEGDLDFIKARANANAHLHQVMEQRIKQNQAEGRISNHLDPGSSALAVLSLLERLGAIPDSAINHSGVRAGILEGAAFMIAILVGGASPLGPAKPFRRHRLRT